MNIYVELHHIEDLKMILLSFAFTSRLLVKVVTILHHPSYFFAQSLFKLALYLCFVIVAHAAIHTDQSLHLHGAHWPDPLVRIRES